MRNRGSKSAPRPPHELSHLAGMWSSRARSPVMPDFKTNRTPWNHCVTGWVQIMNRNFMHVPCQKNIWHGRFLVFFATHLLRQKTWQSALGLVFQNFQIHGRATRSRCHQSQRRSLQQHHRWLKDHPDLVERTRPGAESDFADRRYSLETS